MYARVKYAECQTQASYLSNTFFILTNKVWRHIHFVKTFGKLIGSLQGLYKVHIFLMNIKL